MQKIDYRLYIISTSLGAFKPENIRTAFDTIKANSVKETYRKSCKTFDPVLANANKRLISSSSAWSFLGQKSSE
jgi:hypothetical protein